MTVMILPEGLRRYVRTSNHLERLNRELKRRSTAIGVFPNTDSLNRLMGSVLVEEHEKCLAGRRWPVNKEDLIRLDSLDCELAAAAKEQQKLMVA